jgi:hypothetical protein
VGSHVCSGPLVLICFTASSLVSSKPKAKTGEARYNSCTLLLPARGNHYPRGRSALRLIRCLKLLPTAETSVLLHTAGESATLFGQSTDRQIPTPRIMQSGMAHPTMRSERLALSRARLDCGGSHRVCFAKGYFRLSFVYPSAATKRLLVDCVVEETRQPVADEEGYARADRLSQREGLVGMSVGRW